MPGIAPITICLLVAAAVIYGDEPALASALLVAATALEALFAVLRAGGDE